MRSAATTPPATVNEPVPSFDGEISRATLVALAGMMLLAFLLRIALIGTAGYTGDISTFESWSLTLAQHPIWDFYSSAGFADYPPGYFVVLWFVGHLYTLLVHNDPGYDIFKVFVKMPAILMDLVCTGLIFAIAQRFGSRKMAFVAAALYAFNPAVISISAGWGQVDSVSAAFILGGIYMLIRARGKEGRAGLLLTVGAWLSLSYSLLIKPHALVLVPLFLAAPFAFDVAERKVRLLWTAAGIGASFVLAAALAMLFHPTPNPIELFRWLLDRYVFGTGVYAYNSINAYNLHSVFNPFWKPDSELQPGLHLGSMVIGLPQYVWGIILVITAASLIIWRFLQLRSMQAFLEAACLLCMSYFMLSTRMHERYIFDAFVLTMPLAAILRRYLYAALLITLTLFTNLQYSLWYEYVMDKKLGLNATDLWPYVDHPMSLVNALILFFLLFAYLGTQGEAVDDRWFRDALASAGHELQKARRWFSPIEGIAYMLPVDYAIAVALTVAAFVMSFINYTYPSDRVFDEIYYARAGEEYLQGKDIFEFTHPPLTKLIITLSMILFGGMHGAGDTATGWRFLQLVLGAAIVYVIYIFAKRLFGSTIFATVAAGLLLFDGFRFAQSRIATPEIGIALFSLTTAYCFYRYWLARRVRVAPMVTEPLLKREALLVAGAAVIAGALSWLITRDARPDQIGWQTNNARIVVFFYWMCGFYALIRTLTPRWEGVASLTSYADGSFFARGLVRTPDGGAVGAKTMLPGEISQPDGKSLLLKDVDLSIEYAPDGAVEYVTPEGKASFSPEGTMAAGGETVDTRAGRFWFWMLAFSAGLLGASKWNGLFTIITVILVSGLVALQGYWPQLAAAMEFKVPRRAAIWGNPRGFSWDVVTAGILFVGLTIYTIAYTPYFKLNHNVVDLVELQHGMYAYHHDLKATHPYSSVWWQWPILQRPIQYYYNEKRKVSDLPAGDTFCKSLPYYTEGPKGKDVPNDDSFCISDILALPNPVTWWFGLVSIPWLGVLAWTQRNKGYALLFALYFMQWLPWILSPRLAFEYHFFPNDAIICLADTAVLMWIWQNREWLPDLAALRWIPGAKRWLVPGALGLFGCLVLFAFVYFYPVVSGQLMTHHDWTNRIMNLPKFVFGNDRAWI